VKRSLLKILRCERRLALTNGLALLVCATLLVSLGADVMFARNGAAQTGSTVSANEKAGLGSADQASVPAATAEAEEHGLSRKAVEIGRPFGFPITNSMVVSWIVAAGLILFARIATRDMTHVLGGA